MKSGPAKKDIMTRTDIEKLVDAFYQKVKTDELLSPVFSHVDFPKHMPTMYNFWSSLVFGDQSYSGNPFMRHKDLPIDRNHFDRWLTLFVETVDQMFEGKQASEIKQRAQSIATLFQHRMGLIKE
jgi:hemoglobin